MSGHGCLQMRGKQRRISIRTGVCLAALLVVVQVVWAVDLNSTLTTDDKALAFSAARVNAVMKLVARVEKLRLENSYSVSDFTSSSPVTRAGFIAAINAVGEKKVLHLSTGECDVTLEMSPADIAEQLKYVHKTHYRGGKFKATDFDKIAELNKLQIVSVTGSSKANVPAWQSPDGPMVPVGADDLGSIKHMAKETREFWLKHARMQGRLLAVRAARGDALKRLAVRIKTLKVDNKTTVADFLKGSAAGKGRMATLLRPARETGIRYSPGDLIVELEVSAKLRSVYGMVKTLLQRNPNADGEVIRRLEKLMLSSRDASIAATGVGAVPQQYIKDAPAEVAAIAKVAGSPPVWISTKLTGEGTGKNRRAAELAAERKLFEKIARLEITDNETVGQFMARDNGNIAAMLTFIQGGKAADYTESAGKTVAKVEMELRPLWRMIICQSKAAPIAMR